MHDLFAQHHTIRFPERRAFEDRIGGNKVYQILHPAKEVHASFLKATSPRNQRFWEVATPDGEKVAIVGFDTRSLLGCDAVLRVPNAESIDAILHATSNGLADWICPDPRKATPRRSGYDGLGSPLNDAVALVAEEYRGDEQVRAGFRPPQLGAIYAVKAHWSVSNQAATLVLPTGAGKTDTMVALLFSEHIKKLLVIVPSDALRQQVGAKFASLDVLKKLGLVPSELQNPSVGFLAKSLKTRDEVERLVGATDVIVSTMSLLTRMSAELRAHLAQQVSHLFVDEAHHIGATTWRDFKMLFGGKAVLQFTATPFRNDGRRVDGKFIYVYPLRRAQADKLFTSINFVPIHGLTAEGIDAAIAVAVGEQLTSDDKAGFRHLAMARTDSVPRAKALHDLYRRLLPERQPTLIHSELTFAQRAAALEELRSGRARIIVCVDMLGEGFDLPDLKIAGLHDKHRSEAVTLQFVGRFTRARKDLGAATVIANVEPGEATNKLNALYAEDSDWNHLLAVIGHQRTERERQREDLFSGFPEPAETFPLETIEPRFSTVVYRTKCDEWSPQAAERIVRQWSTIVEPPSLNAEQRLLVFVKRDEERLRWTTRKGVRNISYNLVMAHWNPDQNLLYIHGSDLSDLHFDLAVALAGKDVERVSGEDVFRVLHGFRRLLLTNLGLSETQRKPVRYSQFMGSDIADQLDTLPGNRSRSKTNLFGIGFIDVEEADEAGGLIGRHAARETIGCSRKGKFWSSRTTNSLSEWIEWCHELGRKLLNSSITPENILRNVVRPKRLTSLPRGKMTIGIAWPEEFLDASEENLQLVLDDREIPFFNCEIRLDAGDVGDVIRFSVAGDDSAQAEFDLTIGATGALFKQVTGSEAMVRRGRTRKEKPLIEVFQEDPPHIYFADGDVLIAPDILVLPREDALPVFDLAKIHPMDWSGVNIKAESQGATKKHGTIQRRVIEVLSRHQTPYDIIFDDDGTGEVADVVGVRRSGKTLVIDLFHCKFSAERSPGGRVADLYELCGQAQKSVRWAERFLEMLKHLRRRELDRIASHLPSRFERGSMSVLLGMINQSHELHAEFSVTLVQPGYSKARAMDAHLELFAATEAYLMETWRIPLKVWASA